MGAVSEISWCDATFNIAWGCTKVSEACRSCYAETWAKRHGYGWGPETERRVFGEAHWREPLKWNAKAERAGKSMRVFCSSMADVFEDHPTIDRERQKLWPLIEVTPWLRWMLLTKRPENMVRMAPAGWAKRWPDTVLAMATAEDQVTADRRIAELAHVPAARGLSLEPLLGPIDLRLWDSEPWLTDDELSGEPCRERQWLINFVIVGGESGSSARPMHPAWARSIRDQCKDSGIPFHFKQWGEWAPKHGADRRPSIALEPDGKQRPVHEALPSPRTAFMARVGKKAAGRMLDGRTWDEFPGESRP